MHIEDKIVEKGFNPSPENIRFVSTTERYDLSHITGIPREKVTEIERLADMNNAVKILDIICSNSPINLFNLFRVILIGKLHCPYLHVEQSRYIREEIIAGGVRKESPGLIRDIEGTIRLIPLNCDTPIGTKYRIDVKNETEFGPAGPNPVVIEMTTDDLILDQSEPVTQPFSSKIQIASILPDEHFSATMSVRETGEMTDIKIPSVDEWGYIFGSSSDTRNPVGLRLKSISRGNPITIFKKVCQYIYRGISVLRRKENLEFATEDEIFLTAMTDIVIRENTSIGLFLVRPEDEKRKIIRLTLTYSDPAKTGPLPAAEAWPIFTHALDTMEREIHSFEDAAIAASNRTG
jgi:hypothetical protein